MTDFWEESVCFKKCFPLVPLLGCFRQVWQYCWSCISFLLCMVFRWINVPGTETENKPLPSFDFDKLAVWTHEYLNFKCWKDDSDRISGFWDIANQIKKSGRIYSSRRIYPAKYSISFLYELRSLFPHANRQALNAACFRGPYIGRVGKQRLELAIFILNFTILVHCGIPR